MDFWILTTLRYDDYYETEYIGYTPESFVFRNYDELIGKLAEEIERNVFHTEDFARIVRRILSGSSGYSDPDQNVFINEYIELISSKPKFKRDKVNLEVLEQVKDLFCNGEYVKYFWDFFLTEKETLEIPQEVIESIRGSSVKAEPEVKLEVCPTCTKAFKRIKSHKCKQ